MYKELGNLKKGLLFVVSAPAGTGKTTLTQMLVKEFPCVVQSISYTTRPCRENEIPGVDYNFISNQEFEQKVRENEFLEYTQIYDAYYGTSRSWVEEQTNQGKHVVLVIDTFGAKIIKQKYLAKFIFILPPNLEKLRERLINRKTESDKEIETRINWAMKEIEGGEDYDYFIINDDLQTAYRVFRSIFIAEEHKINYLHQ